MKSVKTISIAYVRLSILVLLAAAGFVTACNSGAREQTKKDTEEFKAYVQAHKDSVDAYTEQKWDEIENEYYEKRAKLEKDTAEMGEELRAEYRTAVNDWEQFKADYHNRSEERKRNAEIDAMRAQLAVEGKQSNFSDVVKGDIVSQYEHFFNTVYNKRDEYTREQWTIVNESWKNLNDRKNAIEADIAGPDKVKIMKIQRDYTAIKAANRPFAESEEKK